MNFIGVDLHKKSITICVMDEKRKILARKTLACTQTNEIVEFFRQFRPFKVVVEATASYVWFVELVEPLAEKVVLANPKKLRVIAESTKKTDNLDAQVLAEFLVLDMIPESYQPTPRLRRHRALVRHRQYLQGRITSVRSKIRHILSNYNADRKDLFSANCGLAYLKEVRLSDVDRFVIKQLWAEWQDHLAQRLAVSKKLKAFVAKAPQREAEAREILKTAPGVGPVTAEVVLSELGDISRPTASSCRSASTPCGRPSRSGSSSTFWPTTPRTRLTGACSRRSRTTPATTGKRRAACFARSSTSIRRPSTRRSRSWSITSLSTATTRSGARARR